jgi:pyruvate/2-oxoglutarate dehydrogenase complex dihydrolipoamide dehydrogenase (E3) component
MDAEQYDVIIIGAGQAGGPLSTAFARAGRKTALIEREFVGGTCINVGCTPTKTMVASARVAHLARRAGEYGVHTGPISVDLAAVRQRKRAIVDSFRSGSQGRIESTAGVDLLFGEGRFSDATTVEVSLNAGGQRQLSASTIIINAGARSLVPPLPGLEDVPFLDSTSIMELDSVPERLIVLGGGYIGLEFAQMFQRFGSQVTVINRSAQLLGREDSDIAAAVAEILRAEGLEILLNTATVAVARAGATGLQITVADAAGERVLSGTHLLVAIGRTPNSDTLDLLAAGVETDQRGFIRVNERLETSVPGIYALGDINGGPAFTHVAYDDYRILRTTLIEGGDATTASRLVPYTVFIDPQLGRVGLSEREAAEQGRAVRVARMPMSYVARALEMDETRGFMKALVDPATDQILGAAVLGVEGGEIMALLQMAMLGRVPYPVLRDGVFAHPTLAESLNNLFMGLDA